jgi:hypothetical protein
MECLGKADASRRLVQEAKAGDDVDDGSFIKSRARSRWDNYLRDGHTHSQRSRLPFRERKKISGSRLFRVRVVIGSNEMAAW